MEAFIRLATMEPISISTDEYDQLRREVFGRIVAGDPGISDRICLKLLEEYEYRYNEAKQQNEIK